MEGELRFERFRRHRPTCGGRTRQSGRKLPINLDNWLRCPPTSPVSPSAERRKLLRDWVDTLPDAEGASLELGDPWDSGGGLPPAELYAMSVSYATYTIS